MEIKEWIRSLGDRARLLVIIPLVAGSLAALMTLIGPSTYESSATIIVAEDPSAGSLPPVTAQRVADLMAVIRSPGVLDAVSRDTGVSRGDLDSGLSVSRSGSSGVVTVTYASSRAEDVGLAAEAVARAALGAVAQARVDLMGAQAQAAQDAFDAAAKSFEDTQNELGETYSDEALLVLQRQVINLKEEADAAAARGDVREANQKNAQVDIKRERIAKMRQLESLFLSRSAALQVLFGAQDRLAQASGSLAAATEQVVNVTRETRQSKLQAAARRFLFVAVIGFFLALGLVILLQLLDRRREGSESDQASGPRRRPAA